MTQYGISFILMLSHSNYPLIWGIFTVSGLIAVALYGILYLPDKRTFPGLYEKP